MCLCSRFVLTPLTSWRVWLVLLSTLPWCKDCPKNSSSSCRCILQSSWLFLSAIVHFIIVWLWKSVVTERYFEYNKTVSVCYCKPNFWHSSLSDHCLFDYDLDLDSDLCLPRDFVKSICQIKGWMGFDANLFVWIFNTKSLEHGLESRDVRYD